MTSLALLVALAAASPTPSPAANVVTKTVSALTLYVDPTGSDTGTCTATGTGACATLQGAENKIPKLVRHPVTVNVASGSYSGLYVYGHSFDPADVSNGAFIKWVGTLTNATVATGTATGTATAGSAGSGTTFGTLTDSGQSWTSDNLKGKLLEITGGTGSGQTRIITTNTSTVITIAGTWGTAPTSSSTYAIRDWGSVASTAVNSPAIPNVAAGTALTLRLEGNGSVRNSGASATALSGSAITFTRMKFAPSTSATGAARLNGPNQVAFVECSINGNTSGTGLTTLFGTYVNVDRSYLSSGTSQALLGSSTNGGANAVAAGFSFFESGAGAGSSVLRATSGAFTAVQITSTNSAALAVVDDLNDGFYSSSIGASRVQCTAGGSTRGFYLSGGAGVAGGAVTFVSAMAILSCPVGVYAQGAQLTNNSSSTVITGTGSQTTGLQAVLGGRIYVAANMTISGYTADITVDGATTSWASLVASSPVVFPTSANPYGSWVGR